MFRVCPENLEEACVQAAKDAQKSNVQRATKRMKLLREKLKKEYVKKLNEGCKQIIKEEGLA